VPLNNYLLQIKTDDGQCGLFDVKAYFDSEVFQPLRDLDVFRRVHNGGYFIEGTVARIFRWIQ
jgi:hypothetical protein